MNEQPPVSAARRTADAATGAVIAGRYVIQRQIARGGMATVYLAEDTLLGRPVAVKVLTGQTDAGSQDAFLQEARAVAKLSHPHIVEVYDAGVEGSLRYIVMQYVAGGTLRELIERDAPLDPRRAVQLTIKLSDALNFGHARGIVHCDVKPGNVLLDDEGEPKIADFGIALSLTQSAGRSDLIAGTAGYISPEQVSGRHIDGRSDVYSLAAVLYEMVGGSPPNPPGSLAAMSSGRLPAPAPLRQQSPFVPEDLERIVMRGLAADPADRYPTAGAFSDALRTYLSGSTQAITQRTARATEYLTERIPVAAQRPAAATSPPGQRRSQPWMFLLLAGTLAAVIVGLAIVLLTAISGGDGGEAVTVPSVTGERVDVAARRVQDAGLRVGDVELRSGSAPFGTVLTQDPAPDAERKNGDTVNFVVSVGQSPP